MATRRSFIATLGLGLFSAAAAWAAPPGTVPSPTPASDPVDTVRRFLAYRATNEWTKAYALLSAGTRRILPLDQFAQVKTLPTGPINDGMHPALSALSALFIDIGDTLGYRFVVVGIAPEDPHVVLVSAQPPAAGAGQATAPFALRIVTAPDPQTGTPRIEMMPSYLKTDPTAFEKTREHARQIASQSNLKQLSLAMLQYLQDYDERYPAADKWVDAITPYLVGTQGTHAQREQRLVLLLHDPSAPDSQKWSYAFNSNLSKLTLAQIDAPATTVLLFESNAGVKNAADTGQSIPRPGRHSGGTDYAFTDGHVKWFRDTLSEADRREHLSFSPAGH